MLQQNIPLANFKSPLLAPLGVVIGLDHTDGRIVSDLWHLADVVDSLLVVVMIVLQYSVKNGIVTRQATCKYNDTQYYYLYFI